MLRLVADGHRSQKFAAGNIAVFKRQKILLISLGKLFFFLLALEGITSIPGVDAISPDRRDFLAFSSENRIHRLDKARLLIKLLRIFLENVSVHRVSPINDPAIFQVITDIHQDFCHILLGSFVGVLTSVLRHGIDGFELRQLVGIQHLSGILAGGAGA